MALDVAENLHSDQIDFLSSFAGVFDENDDRLNGFHVIARI